MPQFARVKMKGEKGREKKMETLVGLGLEKETKEPSKEHTKLVK